jgi:hypothetical protein
MVERSETMNDIKYSEDLMDHVGRRVDIDVDSIPDSDSREDDLNELINFKKIPAFNVISYVYKLEEKEIF